MALVPNTFSIPEQKSADDFDFLAACRFTDSLLARAVQRCGDIGEQGEPGRLVEFVAVLSEN